MLALILLLVLSASMSTLSSLVLVFSSAIAICLYPARLDKTTKKDSSVAMMGVLSGTAAMITLFFVLGASKSPLAASIAIIVPFITVTVVSHFTAPPDKSILDRAFEGIEK